MPKPPRPNAGKVLGRGLSVKQWIAQHPDRFVTRHDVGLLFSLYDDARGTARQRNAWYRRLWRWLCAPLVAEEPEPPQATPLKLPVPEAPSSPSA